MADIKQIEVGDTSYNISGAAIILEDNNTTTAGTWLAKTSQISQLVDGQIFLYKITKAGGSSTTLNITGSAGTALGAKPIYRNSMPLTTQYSVDEYLLLVYANNSFKVINFIDQDIVSNSFITADDYVRGDYLKAYEDNGRLFVDEEEYDGDIDAYYGAYGIQLVEDVEINLKFPFTKPDGTYTLATMDDILTSSIAVCPTDASAQKKLATLVGFTLGSNQSILLYNTYNNTYSGKLQLNVNSTGDKDIYLNGTITSSSNCKAFTTGYYKATYNGSYWNLVPTKNDNYYGECPSSVASTTAAKTATVYGVTSLTSGLEVKVKFINGISPFSTVATLNINGLGAKTIAVNGFSSFVGSILKVPTNTTLTLRYNGSVFNIISTDNDLYISNPGNNSTYVYLLARMNAKMRLERIQHPSDPAEDDDINYFSLISVNERYEGYYGNINSIKYYTGSTFSSVSSDTSDVLYTMYFRF